MLRLLAASGFPGPPRRIRAVYAMLKKYDYLERHDFVGCDEAPLPAEITGMLHEPERVWFATFIVKIQIESPASTADLPVPGSSQGQDGADAFNTLKASLNCLSLPRTASKEVSVATLRTLLDLGIRKWPDLVGATDSLIARRCLQPEVRGLCVSLIDAANEFQHKRVGDERPAKSARVEVAKPTHCPLAIIQQHSSEPQFNATGVGPSAARRLLETSFV